MRHRICMECGQLITCKVYLEQLDGDGEPILDDYTALHISCLNDLFGKELEDYQGGRFEVVVKDEEAGKA